MKPAPLDPALVLAKLDELQRAFVAQQSRLENVERALGAFIQFAESADQARVASADRLAAHVNDLRREVAAMEKDFAGLKDALRAERGVTSAEIAEVKIRLEDVELSLLSRLAPSATTTLVRR